ncbi:MAG: exosome non-catalytic core subunit rrp4 [Bogoriella megaspora]|nr:MAG: exosome non-catalytic core subunit rrp4 [Bogoriella megaspora]
MPISILPPAPATTTISNEAYNDYEEDKFDLEGDLNMADAPPRSSKAIITPGELITEDQQWMRGHGTTTPYPTSTSITSTLFGTLLRTNKLLSITPLRSRYRPAIGDLIIGRIATVSATGKRWHVDIAAPLLASLHLSSINLPGGVLRKRTAVDELNIRQYFVEGELVVAEVQGLYQDGGAALHTRSLRYGKLRNGFFLSVSGAGGEGGGAAAGRKGVSGATGGGVVRSRRQLFTMKAGNGAGEIDVVLGVNGYIWIAKHVDTGVNVKTGGMSITSMEESVSASIYSSQNDEVSAATRREIARVAGCVRALVEYGVKVDEEMVGRAYEAALELEMESGRGEIDSAYLGGDNGRRLVELALGSMMTQ